MVMYLFGSASSSACCCRLAQALVADEPSRTPRTSKVLEISFEAILPGIKQLDQQYPKHPTIPKFLAETTTMPSDTGKRLRVDFCGFSEEAAHENHEQGKTWFLLQLLQAKVRSSAGWNFADVLKDQEQATSLQAESYIAYACSPDFNWQGTMQVEILVHTKASKNNRRGMLVGWLAYSVHVKHVKQAEPICPDRNRPFT